MSLRSLRYVGLLATLLAPLGASAILPEDFAAFESGPVRPLALSADGSTLFAVNVPDNTLEIFAVGGGSLTPTASVPVGLEPVSVAVRSANEVWVVNHLSDSISIVDVAANPPRVTRTLLVGDEPRDLVFTNGMAFVTTAHRGQQRTHPSIAGVPGAGDPQLTTPSVGRADVWVFDTNNLGATLGGTPLKIVSLFGDTPRGLAVSPDGNTVYAAVFNSGNQTTVISEGGICDGGALAGACVLDGRNMPGGLPPPNTDAHLEPAPEVSLIVKYNPTLDRWEDELGRNWNAAVDFDLPDYDVFAIDASSTTPANIVQTAAYPTVGTTLFNLVAHPSSGKLYVSNTEARNEVRFEGPGIFAGSTVLSHLAEARISVIDTVGGTVTPRHLNSHIDYDTVPSPAGTAEDSLASPLEMVLTGDGSTLYVAAFGSSKVGVYPTASLDAGNFDPTTVQHIEVSGGGPSGLALDETNDRLYVLTRFDNAIAVIDTNSGTQVGSVALHNPEPYRVVAGRRFLYDARTTSSNGEASCASCHTFGDMDHLAWDLGNPDDEVLDNRNVFEVGQLPPPAVQAFPDFHPMKGPMTTQSLRGMADHGPMHWRGDRSGANEPGGDTFDEDLAFKRFNPAFVGLLGRAEELTAAEMQAYTDFILEVRYPPNPIRAIDNSLTAAEDAGRVFYFESSPSDGLRTCNGCHTLDRSQGFFGSSGKSSFENETQLFKVAHLRNAYQKIGMFGMMDVDFFNDLNTPHQGDQIRGFGFLHDGSVDTVFRFLHATVFNRGTFGLANSGGFANGAPGDLARRQVEAFVLAFDTTYMPSVGQQVTLSDTNAGVAGPRIDTLLTTAANGHCDLTVKGVVAGEARGWVRRSDGTFESDRTSDAPLSEVALRALAGTPGQNLTYTCVPPGHGERIGIDRDGDLSRDRDEEDTGSDPDDPTSLPARLGTNCQSNLQLANARIKLTKNDRTDGEQRLNLSGGFIPGSVDRGAIDPLANGLTFQVQSSTGVALFGASVPAGAAPSKKDPGWTYALKGAGPTWTFRDREGTLSNGVTKITVLDNSKKVPGQFLIKVAGKNGFYKIDDVATALPLRLVVVLGNGIQAGEDQCASRAFGAVNDPTCSANTKGSTISCK